VVLKKLTSSEVLSSEADHQKLTSSEAGRLKNFKCCSNEDLITPIIAEDWKNKTTANSNESEGIGCLFFGKR